MTLTHHLSPQFLIRCIPCSVFEVLLPTFLSRPRGSIEGFIIPWESVRASPVALLD